MQCDQHVVKMVTETAQMLSTVAKDFMEIPEGAKVYKPTHALHPCTLWAREKFSHYCGLHKHGMALAEEYTYRYGRVHKSQEVIENLRPARMSPRAPLFFALAMPEEYQVPDLPVSSYRNYYINEKLGFARWHKTRPAPAWLSATMIKRNSAAA